MHQKTILIPIDKSARPEIVTPWIETALDQELHLSVLIVGVAPTFPTTAYSGLYYGGTAIGDEWQESLRASAKELDASVKAVEALVQSAGISADVRGAHCEQNLVADEVSSSAAVCDFAALPNSHDFDPTIENIVISALLFNSPVGTIIHAKNPAIALRPKNILIAWNTGLPCARAVHAALPQLIGAEKVTIVSFDPVMREHLDGDVPGSEIASWLSRHGCKVNLQHLPSGEREIALCIEEQALACDADMIVMGAYGRSKMRQRIFGGTTSTVLSKALCPVLMAH